MRCDARALCLAGENFTPFIEIVTPLLPFALWIGQNADAARAQSSRERLLRLLTRDPGLPLGEAARQLGLTWGTLSYHVRRMEADGEVYVRRVGRRTLLYADEPPPEDPPEDRALLYEPAARKIAAVIARGRGPSVNDIIAKTGLTPRVVYHHLKRLIDLGLITTAVPKHHRGLAATPRLLELLRD